MIRHLTIWAVIILALAAVLLMLRAAQAEELDTTMKYVLLDTEETKQSYRRYRA